MIKIKKRIKKVAIKKLIN